MPSIRDSFPADFGNLPDLDDVFGTFKDAALEAAYQSETYALSTRRYLRFSVTASVVAFLAYGVHDWLVVPSTYLTAWAIRYGVFGPIGLLLVVFAFKNQSWQRLQPMMLLLGMGVNSVVLWIGAISPPAGFFIYTSFAIVFVTLGPFLGRMNVKTQVVYTALTIALFLALGRNHPSATGAVTLSIVLSLVTLGAIGSLAARQLEMQGRVAYLQRRVIREQMDALRVERTRSETLLLNVLPRRIAERLKAEPDVTIADGFAGVTVLFSDIVGFTELSARLAPEELVRRLDEIFSRFDLIADELKLEKIKTIGDAYMVAGGVPSPREDHAEAVCEMALAIRDAITEIAAERSDAVGVRIGVHSGPAVAGVIGKKKFIYDVWGDTVNTASRMESHGVPGAIQVSEATYELTKHLFDYEPRGTIKVKGKGEMRTYLLLRRKPPPSDRQAALPDET